MIIVTGGAGFIGSNIVHGLNQRGHTDILVVDDLTDGQKFNHIVTAEISDYMDQEDFLALLKNDATFADNIRAIFHEGACSDTTEWNGRYMMRNNYEYSKTVLHYCLDRMIPFIYASSAAVYGASTVFKEERQYERPLNVYGYSKLQFDQYVRRLLPSAKSQIVGLRYFNVYGPREAHKNKMASVVLHSHNQLLQDGMVKLFEGCDGYENGEQRRDFVYVGDVVDVNLWLLDHPEVSGIFNLGTGRAQSFNSLVHSVIEWHKRGRVHYIPFPEELKGRYQSFTEADITALRTAGYTGEFKTIEEGAKLYLDWIENQI